MTITQTASRLLETYGEAITFTYSTGETLDPITGEVTPGTELTVTGFGYPSRYNNREIDGTLIKQNDIRLVVEKVSTQPQTQWRCTVDGTEYRVEDVQPIRRSGADVIYICRLRTV